MRRSLLLGILLLISVVIPASFQPAFAGGIWTPGEWVDPNSVEQMGGNPANRGFVVRQKLPEGDTMVATLTTLGGEIIKDSAGNPVSFTGTVAPFTEGVSFHIPGIVNGKSVTDFHQTHTDPSVPDGTVEAAAFRKKVETPDPDDKEAVPMGTWLYENGYDNEDNPFFIPDFRPANPTETTPEIFYGIDMEVWDDNGFTRDSFFDVFMEIEVDNGRIKDSEGNVLDGILFSTTQLSYAAGYGWATDSRFTGSVVYDSYHESYSSVPEPATILLLGTGFLGIAGFARRRKNTTWAG